MRVYGGTWLSAEPLSTTARPYFVFNLCSTAVLESNGIL